VAALNSAAATATTNLGSLSLSSGTLLTSAQVTAVKNDASSFSSIFATVGQGFLNLYAQHQAFLIARQHRDDVHSLCQHLEDMILTSPDETQLKWGGLGGIMAGDYDNVLTVPIQKFGLLGQLPSVDPTSQDYPNSVDKTYVPILNQRVAILSAYVSLEAQQNQDISKVVALRKAIQSIDRAHEALAQGQKADFIQSLIAIEKVFADANAAYSSPAKAPASTTTPSTTPPTAGN
jgi:hypothetical protein